MELHHAFFENIMVAQKLFDYCAGNCFYELCNLCLYDRGILVWRTADYCGKYANRRIFQLFKLLDANAYFFDDDFQYNIK